MACPSLEIVRIEINEHLRWIHQSRCDLVEAVAATRKSIDESRALMTKADAAMTKR